LRDEADAVLQGRVPGPADLPQLPYAHAVIQELLRLYPPAWMISRVAHRPVDLPGVQIPRGGVILVPIQALHRRAAVFADPAAFQPARWTPAFAAGLAPGTYLPFGMGPRGCLARHFALFELHLLLPLLAARVVFTPAGHLPVPDVRVTLRPMFAAPVQVRACPA
jgi:cytochrome P450